MWFMRWQRHSVFDMFASGHWAVAGRRLVPSLAVASCLMASAFLVFAPAPSPAEAEEMIESDIVDEGGGTGKGMPGSNPRVKAMLAAHQGEFVTICVAGCAGKPSIVQMLPMPLESRASEMRTTAGSLDGSRRRGPAQPAGYSAASSDATTCVAGCGEAPRGRFCSACRDCRRWSNRCRAARPMPATSRSTSAAKSRAYSISLCTSS
jgi:hypothetical protein